MDSLSSSQIGCLVIGFTMVKFAMVIGFTMENHFFLMGKSNISMAIFNSYVSLLEGS